MQESEIVERFTKIDNGPYLVRALIYLHREFKKGLGLGSIDRQLFIDHISKFKSNFNSSEITELISVAFDSWQYLKEAGGDISKLLLKIPEKQEVRFPEFWETDSYRTSIRNAEKYLMDQFKDGKHPEDIDIGELSTILGDALKIERDFSLIDQLVVSTYNYIKKWKYYDLDRYPDIEDLLLKFPELENNVSLRDFNLLKEQLTAEGKQIRIFNSLDDVLNSITDEQEIEGYNIINEIRENNSFRFICKDFPKQSVKVSEVLAKTVSVMFDRSTQKARKARVQNADDYAKEMYEVINKLKQEQKVSTFRATVDMLNKEEVPTPNGKRWHLGSLQSLNKRWQDLGLGPDPE